MSTCLVLNSSYYVMNLAPWQRAIELVYAGRAEILHVLGGNRVRSSSGFSYPVPTVIRLFRFINRKHRAVELSKYNILKRDNFACQYCGTKGSRANLTVDHVIPKSKGGPNSWENLVACCGRCNANKADRTPSQAGMTLARKPKEPGYVLFKVLREFVGPAPWTEYLPMYGIGVDENFVVAGE